jgi:hypothetical protein
MLEDIPSTRNVFQVIVLFLQVEPETSLVTQTVLYVAEIPSRNGHNETIILLSY